MAQEGFDKGGGHNHGSGGETPSRRRPRGLGAKPPAANEFLRFSNIKTLILAHFFIEKGHAVMQPLWTMLKYFRSLCLKAEAY